MKDYKPGFFTIDDDIIYEGISDPTESWNGWAIPYFTFEVAVLILERMKEAAALTYQFKDNIFYLYDNPKIVDTDGAPFICPPKDFDGVKMWSIGGEYWIWDKITKL